MGRESANWSLPAMTRIRRSGSLQVIAKTVWPEQCRDDCTKDCGQERGHCEPSCCGCERCPDEDDDQDQAVGVLARVATPIGR